MRELCNNCLNPFRKASNMNQIHRIPRVHKPKTTPEVEKLRKLVGKLSTKDYTALCVVAKVTRTTGWRFKTGKVKEISAVGFKSLQAAYERRLAALKAAT